jgi:hypothetical protein
MWFAVDLANASHLAVYKVELHFRETLNTCVIPFRIMHIKGTTHIFNLDITTVPLQTLEVYKGKSYFT